MDQRMFGHVAELLWDVWILIIILFVAIVLFLLLREIARMPYAPGRPSRRRSPKHEGEELPPKARRRALLTKDQAARRSWFGFAARGCSRSEPIQLPE